MLYTNVEGFIDSLQTLNAGETLLVAWQHKFLADFVNEMGLEGLAPASFPRSCNYTGWSEPAYAMDPEEGNCYDVVWQVQRCVCAVLRFATTIPCSSTPAATTTAADRHHCAATTAIAATTTHELQPLPPLAQLILFRQASTHRWRSAAFSQMHMGFRGIRDGPCVEAFYPDSNPSLWNRALPFEIGSSVLPVLAVGGASLPVGASLPGGASSWRIALLGVGCAVPLLGIAAAAQHERRGRISQSLARLLWASPPSSCASAVGGTDDYAGSAAPYRAFA